MSKSLPPMRQHELRAKAGFSTFILGAFRNELLKLRGLRQTPIICIGLVTIVVYLLPTLAGFPTWVLREHPSTTLVPYMHAADTLTFPLGYRPMRSFFVHELLHGRLPLWLPTQMLGLPLLEQSEYQILNPLEWINWLGHDIWWSLVLCGYLIVGAAGVLRLCAALQLKTVPATGGALCYVAAGYAPWFFPITSSMTAIPVIPWLLYFLLGLFRSGSYAGRFTGLCVCLALMFLCGQLQITFCTLFFGAVFFIALSIHTIWKGPDRSIVGWAWLSGAGAVALALALAWPQLSRFVGFQLSGEAYSIHSIGQFAYGATWRTSTMNLLNPVFPFALGVSPYDVWTHSHLLWSYPTEDFPISFYGGGAFLVLVGSLRALTARGLGRREIVITAGLIYGLVVMMSQTQELPAWPFFFINLARYSAPLLSCLGAVLLALGLESLAVGDRLKLVVAAVMIGVAVGEAAAACVYFIRPQDIVSYTILRHCLLLAVVTLSALGVILLLTLSSRPAHRVATAALVIFLADALFQFRYGFGSGIDALRLIPFLTLIAGAVSYALSGRGLRAAIAAASIATCLGWLAFFALYKQPPAPSANFIDGVEALLKGHRVASSIDELLPNRGAALGIDTISSRNPVQLASMNKFFADNFPRLSLLDFRGFAHDKRTADMAHMLSWDEYCAKRAAFNSLAVDMLVDYSRGDLEEVVRRDPDCANGLVPVSNDLNLTIYRDTHALPRAYLSNACALGKKSVTCPVTTPTEVQALSFEDQSSDEVDIDLNGHSGFVVLNDAAYSDWHAYVDGHRTAIYLVNGLVRGIQVPAGARLAKFVYEPRMLPAWLISATGMLVLALFSVLMARRRRSTS